MSYWQNGEKLEGPPTWEICSSCNYDTHICPLCGEGLTHAEHVNGTRTCQKEF